MGEEIEPPLDNPQRLGDMKVHKNKPFASFLLGVCLVSATGWTLPVASSQAKSDPTEEPALIILLAAGQTSAPDAVVAGVNSGHSPIDVLSTGSPVSARLGITQRLAGQIDPERPEARLQRYIVLTYPPGTNLDDVETALLADPRIEAVGENLRGSFSVAATDPLFSPPPGGDPTQYQWGSYALNLPAAWDRIKGHAYIGLLDIGLMIDHPDLRAFHVDGSGTTYYDGGNFRPQFSWNFDQSHYGPDVDELGVGNTTGFAGHGTHTSGIIAATPNNGIGVAGACWHCSLMMARDLYLPTDEIANAFTWLTSHGSQVINFSGRSPLDPGKDCSNLGNQYAGSQMICDALSFADEHDVVFAVSSGNDLGDINFPARDPRVLAVGGIQAGNPNVFWQESVCPLTGTQECGSNYTVTAGRRMQDLVAPAKDVLSTVYTNYDSNPTLHCGDHFPQGLGVTDPTPGYGTCTGTSMSAPHVAGIAGLLRSANPLLTKGNVRSLLLDHADRAGAWDPRYGYGVPNAGASVTAALGTVGGRVLPNRLTPLFSLYSSIAQDYFYTTAPQMAVAAISGNLNGTCDPQADGSCKTPPALVPYSPVGPPVPGYPQFPFISCTVSPCTIFPAASVYIFTTEAPPFAGAPPLVPLYRMSYKDPTPGSLHRDVTYTTDTAGILAFKGVGYDLDGIEGYIYAPCTPEPGCIPPGAVRLHRRYNPQRDDFAIFPESELTQMLNQGYTSTGGASEIIGYVYPNIDSDGDGLIDGFELLIGTNPLVADSDCDGLTDGQELLNYPYTDPLGPGCAGSPVWVSTQGNDGNSCNYAAPCRTFAGALSRIASGGEIDVLDSGDFGPLTINKSVSLISAGPLGGIQATTGNAITINAGPNDKVVLRGLTLDGLGMGATGVSFVSGGSLYVEGCTINNFSQYGIDFAPSGGGSKLFVTDTLLRGNGAGATGGGAHLLATTGAGFLASFDRLRSEGNVVGLNAETLGTVTVRNSVAVNNGYSGFSATTPSGSGSVQMLIDRSLSAHNGTYGFLSNNLSTITLSNNAATDNQFGLGALAGGQILSLGNNMVHGNTTDGDPTQTITNR